MCSVQYHRGRPQPLRKLIWMSSENRSRTGICYGILPDGSIKECRGLCSNRAAPTALTWLTSKVQIPTRVPLRRVGSIEGHRGGRSMGKGKVCSCSATRRHRSQVTGVSASIVDLWGPLSTTPPGPQALGLNTASSSHRELTGAVNRCGSGLRL